MFLEVFLAFDKVWHKSVIFKLKQNHISGNLLKRLANFFKDRKQRIVLNGQDSSWADVTAGVPQESILGLLLCLSFVNDLATGPFFHAKLFPDDISLFSVTHDINTSENELKNYVAEIDKWAFQWKMNFNPGPRKQAQEVIFNLKSKKISHPPLFFDNIQVSQSASHKHWYHTCQAIKILRTC